MTVSARAAAHTLCALSDWRINNLTLGKTLYLGQMVHLARHEEPLVHETFRATLYGPIVEELHDYLRMFGTQPIRNRFYRDPVLKSDTPEYETLKYVSDYTRDLTPGQLVHLTHWDRGAWSRYFYVDCPHVKIPNAAIIEECRARHAASLG